MRGECYKATFRKNIKQEVIMEDAIIVSGVRTPIVKFGGSLKDISAVKLGSIVSSRP